MTERVCVHFRERESNIQCACVLERETEKQR